MNKCCFKDVHITQFNNDVSSKSATATRTKVRTNTGRGTNIIVQKANAKPLAEFRREKIFIMRRKNKNRAWSCEGL